MNEFHHLEEENNELEEINESLRERIAQLAHEGKTLRLALQACQKRIQLQDAALTGVRLLLEGTSHATGSNQ